MNTTLNQRPTGATRKKLLLSACLMSATMLTQPSFAQDQSDNIGLDEVIVTAERRAQRAQDVPISLTTFTSEAIKPSGIDGLADISAATPNLTVTEFNIGEPQLYMRGIGSTIDSAGADPSVGVFLDDVYIGRTGGSAFDLYDLDRIEILRGPQGTLYGRNVTGGAISVHSKAPSDEFEAKLGLTVGDFDLFVGRGYITGPISDRVNGKLAFNTKTRGGYAKNVLSGQELDDAGGFSLRGQLLFQPDDLTDITVSGDFGHDQNNGRCRFVRNLDVEPSTQVAGGAFLDFIRDAQAQSGITDPRECGFDLAQNSSRDMGGVSARVVRDMGWGTLTSITAYRKGEYKWIQELGSMNAPPNLLSVEDNEGETSTQLTQEFRLGGESGALNWVVGAFGIVQDVDRFARVPIQFSTDAPQNGLLLDRVFTQDAKSESIAGFAQGTYEIADGLSITLGGRYTHDKKTIDQFYNQNGRDIYDVKDASDSWSRFTTKATLDYKVTDDVLLYATYSEGFKSGVFVSQTTSPLAAETSLKPEDATNYEIGMKGRFFDNRLQANITAFDLEVEDLHLFRLVGFTLESANTDARSKGIEADFQIAATENLRLGGTFSLMDAEYVGGTFDGNRLARAPEWSYSLNGQYTHELANGGDLEFGTAFSQSGDYHIEATNTPVSLVDKEFVWDASIAYVEPDGQWDVELWVKNLTDELRVQHSINSSFGGATTLFHAPRTVGITGNIRFD